ncbi:hypothetical protein ABKA04_005536 [Annulohypoxylon sp. FPYF3050]
MCGIYHHPTPAQIAEMEAWSALEEKIVLGLAVFMVSVLAMMNIFFFGLMYLSPPREISMEDALERQPLKEKENIKWWLHDYDSEEDSIA